MTSDPAQEFGGLKKKKKKTRQTVIDFPIAFYAESCNKQLNSSPFI